MRASTKSRFRKIAALLCFLVGTIAAQPHVFLDTFGPNNATRPDAVGFGRVPGGAIHTASGYFRVDRDTVLTRIEMGVQLRDGANEVEVVLQEENPGAERPGAAIESYRRSGAMERRTSGYGVLRLDSTLRPVLHPGRRYWISALGGAPDTFAGWGLNNVGDINPTPVPKGIAATNPRPAMRLWGEFAGGRLLLQAVHSGRFGAGLAKDTWISLFGEGLSATTRAWSEADFVDGRVPTELDGVRVLIDGQPAALAYVSPDQINALVLHDSGSESATVEVTLAGESTNSLQVRRYAAAPGAFGLPGTNEVAAIHADGTVVGEGARTAARQAQPGDVIAIFATGLGATSPGADANLVSQPPVPVGQPVEVQLNGRPAEVLYAGRVGPGLFQINIRIPADTPRGTPLPVQIVVSGAIPLAPLLPSTDPTITIP